MAEDVRRADALGLTPIALLSSAPVTIGDLAQALTPTDGADLGPDEATASSFESEYRALLSKRYAAAIEDRWNESDDDASYFVPIEDSRMRLVYIDEPIRIYNESGRDFNEGFNFYASDRLVARLANRFVLTARPELSFVENHGSDSQLVLRMQELHVSGRLGGIELSAGRMPLRWGPGRHGSLLISNNARPLDMVKVSTAGPALLPGFLGALGLFKGEVFASRLESGRAVSRPYFAGARLSARPCPYLELGASRTAQFGGSGRSVGWDTIWNIITADTENDPNDPGNQLASVDARVIVPWSVQPFELYTEFGGEDEAGGFFSDVAVIAGIYLPRVGPWSEIEWTFEVADNTISGDGLSWYTNVNYPDGYTYRDRILGHHMGTDARDIFTELRLRPTSDMALFASFDYEEHFISSDVEERLQQFRFGADVRVWKAMWVSAFVGVDHWDNFEQERGNSRTGFVGGIGAAWNF